jgi:hypothetical protein
MDNVIVLPGSNQLATAPDEKTVHIHVFFYYHWGNTSAGGLLVPGGIILPVVSGSAQTWFIR